MWAKRLGTEDPLTATREIRKGKYNNNNYNNNNII